MSEQVWAVSAWIKSKICGISLPIQNFSLRSKSHHWSVIARIIEFELTSLSPEVILANKNSQSWYHSMESRVTDANNLTLGKWRWRHQFVTREKKKSYKPWLFIFIKFWVSKLLQKFICEYIAELLLWLLWYTEF